MSDVIVVGSGASAVHAAWPLVEAGLRVLMLDAGETDERYAPNIPALDFTSIRSKDEEQHRYFLGDDFEGIPFGPVRVGAQLTPPRQHIYRHADEFLPVVAENFSAMRSLALGGLAAGWGAGAPPFSDADLLGWPISRADLQPHYEAVANRIGISGTNEDDLHPFHDPPLPLLPPSESDSNARTIFNRYRRRRVHLNAAGFRMGAPRLAAVTTTFRGRGPLAYNDMEFWADKDRAVYRPVYTLEELRQRPNFEYRSGFFVDRFEDGTEGVGVFAREMKTREQVEWKARQLVLAAGCIGSSHVVLRSLGDASTRLPLVANPYTYYPCIVWARLGRPVLDRRHSLTQLSIYYEPRSTGDAVLMAQIYSYRSLLTFKLLKETSLPHREAMRIMQLLQSYFVIVGIHHEDRPSTAKYLHLERADSVSSPTLRIAYTPSREELSRRERNERDLMRLFPALGCLPLKRINPGEGASIHYAGCLPMTREDRPFTTTPEGLLRGTSSIYIADGAAFPHLPAKGLTFTLMANANRVGECLASRLTAR